MARSPTEHDNYSITLMEVIGHLEYLDFVPTTLLITIVKYIFYFVA